MPGLGKNDPYNNMERKDIAPKSFGGGGKDQNAGSAGANKSETGKSQNNPNDPKAGNEQNRQNAQENLGNAEQNAANEDYESPGMGGLFAGEESPGEIINNVVRKTAEKSTIGRMALNAFGNKKSPIITMLILVFAIGGIMLASQSMVSLSWVEQLKEKYDSLSTTAMVRSNKIFNLQLQHYNIKPGTKAKGIFGQKGLYYSLSDKQQQHLAKQGITMEELDLGDGKMKNVLLYDDGTGAPHVIAADPNDVSLIKAKYGTAASSEIDIGSKKITVNTSDVDTFQNQMKKNDNFFNSYSRESLSWRGSVDLWFNVRAANFLNRFGITRKVFGNFIAKTKALEDGNAMRKRAIEAIKNSGTQETGVGDLRDDKFRGEDEEPQYDEDGNELEEKRKVEHDVGLKSAQDEQPQNYITKNGQDIETTSDSQGSLTTSTYGTTWENAKKVAGKVAEFAGSKAVTKATKGASFICAGLRVINTATLVASAQEMVQMVKATSTLMEIADKSQTPDADGAPKELIDEALLKPTDTVIYTDNGREVISSAPEAGIQAESAEATYTNRAVDPDDPSVASFSFGNVFKTVLQKIAGSDFAFTACSIAMVLTNSVQLVGTVAACIASFGIGCLVSDIGATVLSISIQTAVRTIIIPAITTALINKYARDIVGEYVGVNFVNATYGGAGNMFGGNGRAHGQILASFGAYQAYRVVQQEVIAERARYERSTRSPFDATSQYTFLGSLMKQIITLGTMSGPTNIVSGLTAMTGNSILALLPSASAADEIAEDMLPEEVFNERCPYLASIKAYGDSFCNPYVITDASTIDIAPDEIEADPYIQASLNSDGSIKDGSDLAKFVLYCGQRTSPFGIDDNNIAESIGTSTPIDSTLGYIPVVGDIISIANEQKKLNNAGWISGENCVAGNTTDLGGANLDKLHTFAEYDSVISEMGGESTIDAYLEKYYQENPLDNSYEGVLARFSGVTKDDVVASLDWINYQRYIANYDPSERYVFHNNFEKAEEPIYIENDSETLVGILQHEIVYADTRNRAFAMA